MLEIISNEIVKQVDNISKNVEFVNVNVRSFEDKHKGTALCDDLQRNLIDLLGQMDKIRGKVEDLTNGIFIHTPRDKLVLPKVEVPLELPEKFDNVEEPSSKDATLESRAKKAKRNE